MGRKVHNSGVFRKLMASYNWTVECENACNSLLHCVVLAQPDFSKPLILSIDALLDRIGAVLSQIKEGESKARPIAFQSKTLSKSQKRYPAHCLEFLALKWNVCHWLKGHFSPFGPTKTHLHNDKPEIRCL